MGKIFAALEKAGQTGQEAGQPMPFAYSDYPTDHASVEAAQPTPAVQGPDQHWDSQKVFLDFVKRVPAREVTDYHPRGQEFSHRPRHPYRQEPHPEQEFFRSDYARSDYARSDSSRSDFTRSDVSRLDPSLVTALDPKSIEAEQFRLLKNNILFPEKGNPPRSIMVTSPSPDEGKSFVSTNLAVSIAQSIDEYVLLMDCDLRRPSVHTLLGIEQTHGLSDHLSSGIPLPPLLKKTFIEKLTLLPGGTVPPNPSELLSSEQMRRLLREVKARYSDRYVIIDTPPPQITSETNAIARIVDGIVIVVRQGVTKKKEIQDIVDIYGRQKILGVIKNFATATPALTYRYKKYGYRRS